MVGTHSRNKFLKRREGISLVECLVMIIIVAFTIGAILQTTVSATKLQTAGRKFVDSHRDLVSFLNILDSFERDNISGDATVIRAIKKIAYDRGLGSVVSANVEELPDNGVIVVSVTFNQSDTSQRTIRKYYNSYNNRTVSDDREKNEQ